ncbi:MAG: hypothetical protein M3N08_08680, partial [Pseudomonadota bacterium]|nr:hypothetical protein [Pseudomonadota bacterium]
AWRDHYSAKVACFEFGVDRDHVDDKSRYNWIRDVRGELESVNIPWALWEYRGPFGIVDMKGNLDKGVLDALALGQNKTLP